MKKVLLLALLVIGASGAFAATVTKVSDDAFAPLRASSIARKFRLDRLPIYDSKRSVIDLEEFQVWAPGGKVTIHGGDGAILKTIDPPPMRFFRGLVNGDPESFAYFAMDPSGKNIQGWIVTLEKRFAIASVRRARKDGRGHLVESADDIFLTEYDDADNTAAPPRKWECAADRAEVNGPGPVHVIGPNGMPLVAQGISGTQSYAMTVEIETDYELYTNAGGNTTAITNYITNLTGAVSTIYNRDLKTNVTQTNINIYTAAADPWTQTDGGTNSLNEIGDVYHNATLKPSGRTTSAVVMLSGKNTGSGIAWLGVICGGDFVSGGHWGGPYAFCGSIGVGGLPGAPDPNATNDGVADGMPAYNFSLTDGSQTYWPLAEYAHELGHNLAGEHTHCVAITDAERVASGFTDGSTADFVDHCYGSEGTGCFSGPNYHAGAQGIFKGTIMSYCHNLFGGTGGVFPQSRYIFGVAAEPSHHELDDYMLNPLGPLNGGTNIVNGVGAFTISAITAPSSVMGNSTGNAASITASPSSGATYAWTIVNGTITSATTGSSITFTAGASGSITLRATAYSPGRCGVTDTKTVAIVSVSPPTGVIVTGISASSVSLSWTAATGATSYHIYRSADHLTYSQVPGNPTGTSFTDITAASNTAYLYRVRSFDGANESADSNSAFATTVVFTDGSLSGTAVKAVHLTELRTAVSAVHVLAGLGIVTFTDPVLDATVPVKAAHLNELRSNLDAARATLGLTPVSYTDGPSVTGGLTIIKAAHLNELRAGVQ